VKIGLVQTRPGPQLDHNRDALAAALAEAFQRGAQLVVAPELAGTPYFPPDRATLERWAEPLDGPLVESWRQLAARHGGYVVGGLLERAPDGTLYNAAVLVDPDGVRGVYRKVHLFHWERAWCRPGDHLTLVTLDDGTRVGLLICYDLRFGEAVRSLAAAGMDLLAVPTGWTGIGKSVPWDRAGYSPQNHLAIGHAYAHRVAVACANRVGQDGEVTFLGTSLAVAPDGAVLAGPLAPDQDAVAVAELPLVQARQKTVGGVNDVLRDRRPTVYRRVRRVP
jgi:predicted amidohydrolase